MSHISEYDIGSTTSTSSLPAEGALGQEQGETRINCVITSDTTFDELLKIIQQLPAAVKAAAEEMKMKKDEEQKAKIQSRFFPTHEFGWGKENQADGEEEEDQAPMKYHRPGASQLRATMQCLGKMKIGESGCCEIFENGYAVYDNGNRKTVLWIPDCGKTTYYFVELREGEKNYMNQKFDVTENLMGNIPWYNALVVAGENRIERNMEHPKSKGTQSDAEPWVENVAVQDRRGICAARFENPEEAYIRKEEREACFQEMTERQREVYELYFDEGYSQREIARMLGIFHNAVGDHLKAIKKHMLKVMNE